ncbi:MAG: helix-turn-helix domain-containing protein [Christensenellales bacterium]|jgi:transcriptional regulator with XRE-family HTH domain
MFSVRLKELRKEKGLSQVELARELALSQTAISEYERGVKEPGREVLIACAGYFGCSVDYLLGRTSVRQAAVLSDDALPRTLRDRGVTVVEVLESALYNGELTEETIAQVLHILSRAMKKKDLL